MVRIVAASKAKRPILSSPTPNGACGPTARFAYSEDKTHFGPKWLQRPPPTPTPCSSLSLAPPCPPARTSRATRPGGEMGRRTRLKISREATPVQVRILPRALQSEHRAAAVAVSGLTLPPVVSRAGVLVRLRAAP